MKGAVNPVLRRERRRLLWGDRWIWFTVLLLWLPLSWVLRVYWLQLAGGVGAPTGVFQSAVLYYLPMVARPDVIIGLAMAARLFPAGEWQREREDLLVTLLTPGQILRGKIAAMWVFIIALMVVAAPVFYVPLLGRIGLTREDVAAEPLLTSLGLGAAILEDIAFAAVCVLLAIWGTLRWRDPFGRVIRVIVCTGAVGVAVAGVNFVSGTALIELTNAIYWSELHFAVVATLLFAGGALMIELCACLWLWRRCMRLYSSDDD